MSDQFTQFHYKLSKASYCPDYEAKDFDIKDIYVHTCLDTAVRESDSPVEVS